MHRSRTLQVGLVLLLFTVIASIRHFNLGGDDLSSSYIGCRVLAAGAPSRLYSHDPVSFDKVADPLWNAIALQSGFTPQGVPHPYVQTPLWGYLLEPLCTHTRYRSFCDFFVVLMMLSTAGTLWLVARHWAPTLFHPGWMALICVALYVCEPFKYAFFLVQTHILFIFLSVLALLLARDGKPVKAGFVLAFAAAVKITPGFLLIYWLFTRQRKAAVSFVMSFAALVAITLLATGPALMKMYVHELSQTSNVLLVAFNNQSLAAWWMGHTVPKDELYHWHSYLLPPVLKSISVLLTLASAVVGGLLDRRLLAEKPGAAPYGAVFTMVGVTMFTPIAWTHYYILLVIPAMLLIDAQRRSRVWHWAALALVLLVLNTRPVSYNPTRVTHGRLSLMRSQFYSGVVGLAALVLLTRSRLGAKNFEEESTQVGSRSGTALVES